MNKTASDFRANTHLRFIADLCERGISQNAAFGMLEPLVMDQIEPMIFTRNPIREEGESKRVPLPLVEQVVRLREAIGRIYGLMGRTESGTMTETTTTIRPEITPEPEIVQIRPVPESKPTASGKTRRQTELEKFIAALIKCREILSVRKIAEPTNTHEVANRPFEAGGNLIPRGFSSDALLHMMSLTWSQDLKSECGIPQTFDYLKLSADLADEFDVKSEWNRNGNGKPIHPMLGMVRALADARQPIYLYGDHGTGKSYLARQLATLLDVPYGETPMSLGATRGDLLGRFTASQIAEKSFIAAQFPTIYGSGGVFNFEEFDASDPRMVIVLNNALSSSHFYNSMTGEGIEKSDGFIACATANTLAQGATARFNREKLDAATLDRWNMGRVPVDFDLEIALYLARNSTRPYLGQ